MTVSRVHELGTPPEEPPTAGPGDGSSPRDEGTGEASRARTDSAETPAAGAASFGFALGAKTREWLERWSSKVARRNIILLAARGNIAETLHDVPEQMHKVARQTQLVIEFVDDFRSGRYRNMPWWAVAVAATALLYAVNPADAIPNALPIVGMLDDLAVVAVATRILKKELRRYCEFKGYPVEQYF